MFEPHHLAQLLTQAQLGIGAPKGPDAGPGRAVPALRCLGLPKSWLKAQPNSMTTADKRISRFPGQYPIAPQDCGSLLC